MGQYINIRLSDDNPLYINTEDLSAIVIQKQNHDGEEKELMAIHSGGEQVLLADMKLWEIDPISFVSKIFKNDETVCALPFVWGDGKDIGTYYVNPKKVQSIIVSGTYQKDDEREPHVGLLVDVKGYGRVETYRVPVSAVNAFVEAVEKVNPNLMRFESEDISTRWPGDDGYTIIDPTEIRNIYPNGWYMDISFKDGIRLDFHLDQQKKVDKARKVYLNKLMKRIQGDGPEDVLYEALDGNLNNLLPRAEKYAERCRRKLRENFAKAVAAKVPDIVEIKGAKDVYYTRLDDITYMNATKKALSIQFKKVAGQRYGDDMAVWYDDKEKAVSEMKRLQRLAQKKK